MPAAGQPFFMPIAEPDPAHDTRTRGTREARRLELRAPPDHLADRKRSCARTLAGHHQLARLQCVCGV